MVNSKESTTEVPLPDHLVQRVERRVPGTEFDNSSEYIAFILEEILSRVEQTNDVDGDVIDEQEVENRLRSLGYMDQ